MAKKNKYIATNHPVTNNMNVGVQQGRLYGKLNVATKSSAPVEPDNPDDSKDIVMILDGNIASDDMIWDGNI